MQNPSAELVDAATALLEASGADGRRYRLRRMNVLDRLRLFRAVGAVLSGNEAYLGIAYLACAVAEIDGVPVPMPGNEAQIEAMVARLGDGGIAAVAAAFAAESAAQSAETAPGN